MSDSVSFILAKDTNSFLFLLLAFGTSATTQSRQTRPRSRPETPSTRKSAPTGVLSLDYFFSRCSDPLTFETPLKSTPKPPHDPHPAAAATVDAKERPNRRSFARSRLYYIPQPHSCSKPRPKRTRTRQTRQMQKPNGTSSQ